MSPVSAISKLWTNHYLIVQMTRREVIGRYRGSVMGLLWSFFNPLFMLAVYTFVFGYIFQARIADESQSKADFSVYLFSGLIVYSFFSECLNRSPRVILENVNYVKRVVFPLEILSCVTLGAALFHTSISVLVLLVFYVAMNGFIYWTVILAPLVLFPLLLLTLGISWFLASLGVFVRDIGQIVGIASSALLFLSPVFYSLAYIPEPFQFYVMLNPLTFIIEQFRLVMLDGVPPDWSGLLIYLIISLIVSWLGYFWFNRTRNGFADVL